MKCKNCGGEIRLEDMYCTWCGSPNEEARRHAKAMQQYRQEFQETKQEVIERTGRHTGRAVRFATVAILLIAIAANFILQMNSYSLFRSLQESKLKKDASTYRDKMEAYLEAEDYCGFAAFCSNRNLPVYDDAFKDYYVIYRVASDYQRAVMDLMQLVDHGPYTNVDNLIKYSSEAVQSFYEDLDPEKYSYYDNYDTRFVQGNLKNMTDMMGVLCVGYLDMTTEEAQSLPDLSRGDRIILIEKGLKQYADSQYSDVQAGEAATASQEK